MVRKIRKAGLQVLIALLALALLVPTVGASQQVTLVFNGQDYQAELYVDQGISYISTEALAKIPGLAVEQEGYVPLRSFFEERGGEVAWDNVARKIVVSWRERQDGWSADELVMESTRILQELNTYRMEGQATMEMVVTGPGAEGSPEMPNMTTHMAGVFQQEPLAMYMEQSIELPLGDQMTPEEQALFGQGAMITKMVWMENAIYQKMPHIDQWIVQDLGELNMMENLTNLIQTTPQQSLEMMREFGIIYVFGDDKVIAGGEYYTVKNYVDSATYKKVLKELMGGMDLAGLVPEGQELPEEAKAEIVVQMQQMIEQLISTMEINYYVDTFINKETLLTEYMVFNMEMGYLMDGALSPAGPISFTMKMVGEAKMFDFGTELELPDVSDAISQQEYLELMMQMVEPPAHS